MVREISTEIGIGATAERVWDVLVYFAAYPQWNPFLLSVRGAAAEGQRIRFRFELPRGFRAPACATILTANRDKELRWAGGVPGFFRAEHYFVIERSGAADVRFRHGEIFSGWLLPLVWPILARGGKEVYDAMNVALKERAERAGT